MKTTKKETFRNIGTVRETIRHAKSEGVALSEPGLRRWIREGKIHVAYVGNRALVSWAAIMAYINGTGTEKESAS